MYNTKALIVNTYFFPGRSFISYIFVLAVIVKATLKQKTILKKCKILP